MSDTKTECRLAMASMAYFAIHHVLTLYDISKDADAAQNKAVKDVADRLQVIAEKLARGWTDLNLSIQITENPPLHLWWVSLKGITDMGDKNLILAATADQAKEVWAKTRRRWSEADEAHAEKVDLFGEPRAYT